MSITEIFQVLGIEVTKDETALKKAYREKLAVTNPEDNPEGFKRLRTAYEEACAYAKAEDTETEEETDDTPSGQWVQRVAELYLNIHTRKDAALWETLFQEDLFLSLEEEENCRMKLFVFLMDHFKLPTQIWKLLEEKLHITDSVQELKEHFPAEFVSYMLNRCTQGDDTDFDKFEGPADADYDLFLQYSNQCWEALGKEQYEQAADFIRNADDLGIRHPMMEVNRAWLWERQGKTDEAIALLEEEHVRDEGSLMINYHLAELLWMHERRERASQIYECILKGNEKHYMANKRLAEWYYDADDCKKAKKHAEEVLREASLEEDFKELLGKINEKLEQGMEQEYLENPSCEKGLDLCWCYLQDGRFSKGISLAVSLEKMLTLEKKSEYLGLMAKLYVESAQYEKSVQMAALWEEALHEKLAGELSEEDREKNEDRVKQSYAVRSYCYRCMGYKDKEQFQRALEFIEKAENPNEPDLKMMMEKAYVYMEMGEYDKCLDLTRILVEDYQLYAAYAPEQKAYQKMWDAQGVLQSGYNCIHYYPEFLYPYERMARVYADFGYKEELQTLLEDAKSHGLESVLLEAAWYRISHEIPDSDVLDEKLEKFREEYTKNVEDGKAEYYEKGLPLLTEYLYWLPGPYMLVERALFHQAAGKYEEAIADFDKALEEEMGNPYAYNGLSRIYKLKGDFEQALVCNRKAIYYFEEEYVRSYADEADLYMMLGEYQLAYESYQNVLRVGGDKVRESRFYMQRYALILMELGRKNEGIEVLDGIHHKTYYGWYKDWVELQRLTGEETKARLALHEWKRIVEREKTATTDEIGSCYNSMAWQELVFGDAKAAIEWFEKQMAIEGEEDPWVSGVYCDTIIACILNGDDETGRDYAARLRKWQETEKAEGRNDYYEADKGRLQLDILALYYEAEPEALEEMLAKEATTNICSYCTSCVCKEVEAVRILFLFSMGKEEEAWERLRDWEKKHAKDEYLLAIKKQCAEGVKITKRKNWK